MAGERAPGALGRDPFDPSLAEPPQLPATGGFSGPGPTGSETELDNAITQTVKDVKIDWDPTVPVDTSKDYEVSGKTLFEVQKKLIARGNIGEGGGKITNDAITDTTSTELTVSLHVACYRELPKWKERSTAKATSGAKWDAMLAALVKHENRHVEIIVEEANKLAKDLPKKDVKLVVGLVKAAGAAAAKREKDLDTTTENGTKAGVTYGDVVLDTDETDE